MFRSLEERVVSPGPISTPIASGRSALAKAIFDRLSAGAGLVIASPLFLLAALAVMLEDRLPIVFRQARIGRHGKPFQLLKFRSMCTNVPGARITAGKDPRLTRVGKLLRRYKIDELPQLWNVLKGEMSLVGPRPEVPAFVDTGDPAWQVVLQVRPGITDLATLVYRNEEEILASSDDPETYYRDTILPSKLIMNLQYMRAGSLWLDLKLILLTIRYSFFPASFDPDRIRRTFLNKGSQ